jgi:hypothetical protein
MGKTFWHFPHDHFHHGKVLEVIVCLIEGYSCVKFDEDAPE